MPGKVHLMDDSLWEMAQLHDRDDEGPREVISAPTSPTEDLHPDILPRSGARFRHSRPRTAGGSVKEAVLKSFPKRVLPPTMKDAFTHSSNIPDVNGTQDNHNFSVGTAEYDSARRHRSHSPPRLAHSQSSPLELLSEESEGSCRNLSFEEGSMGSATSTPECSPGLAESQKSTPLALPRPQQLSKDAWWRRSFKVGYILREGDLHLKETFALGLRSRWVHCWAILDETKVLRIYHSRPSKINASPKVVLRLSKIIEVRRRTENAEFQLVKSNGSTCDFKAADVEEQRQWVLLLLTKIEEFHPSGMSALSSPHNPKPIFKAARIPNKTGASAGNPGFQGRSLPCSPVSDGPDEMLQNSGPPIGIGNESLHARHNPIALSLLLSGRSAGNRSRSPSRERKGSEIRDADPQDLQLGVQ